MKIEFETVKKAFNSKMFLSNPENEKQRIALSPTNVSLCDKDNCNAGEKCCHLRTIDKIKFCISYPCSDKYEDHLKGNAIIEDLGWV